MKRIILILLALLVFIPSSHARVRIDLTDPNADPLPVAISPFYAEEGQEAAAKIGSDIREVVVNDLLSSALFDVADKKAYLQSPVSLKANGPVFSEWRLINIEALLAGNIEMIEKDGIPRVKVEFRVFDVHGEKQLIGRRYTVDARYWRHLAHRIADDMYTTLTGEKGYFTTRIVFIGEETSVEGKRIKKLCVMDQDAHNPQCLTDGSHLVLTPRFNPLLQKIIYMSYANGTPRLYLHDLPTGKQEIVGDFEGLNSSPRFAPDGKTIAMTLTKGHAGNPEIYNMDLRTKKLRRLTFHRGIDTSPSYSPDGRKIVFNSNRGGSPNLYIMESDGNRVKRLTYGEGRYYAPVWSPRGDLIAFVKELNGRFHIGVIDPEGEEERLLTDSYMDESPSWSPNGRVIIFSRQLGDKVRLYSIDITGYNETQIPTPGDASDPAWSPLLQ